MSHAALIAGYANPLIAVEAVDFDGTTDYLNRSAGLTGAADSKSGMLSVWVRFDGGEGVGGRIFGSATTVGGLTTQFFLNRSASNSITIAAYNSAVSQILRLDSTNTFSDSATWHHILTSFDLATGGARSLYIDDIDVVTETTFINDTIDYTVADWATGATPGGTIKTNGCLAELYFAPGQYLDFSLVSNRRKFISASGKPVHLGATGALPTGTAPIVYLQVPNGGGAGDFTINLGTGGDFSDSPGSLPDIASSSPSD
jgi:hypothetical protein